MVGGHILLAIVLDLTWEMMCSTGVFFLFHYTAFLTVILRFLLEIAIALIQALAFFSIICIHIGDVMNLH